MTGQSRRIVGVISALQERLWLMWIVVAVIVILAVTGLARLRFDDELIRFFDSDIPAFDDYVALAQAFEGDTNDVIVLVEAADQSIIEDLRDRLARHPEVASLTTTMVLKTWCERISGIYETAPEGYVITREGKLVS